MKLFKWLFNVFNRKAPIGVIKVTTGSYIDKIIKEYNNEVVSCNKEGRSLLKINTKYIAIDNTRKELQ